MPPPAPEVKLRGAPAPFSVRLIEFVEIDAPLSGLIVNDNWLLAWNGTLPFGAMLTRVGTTIGTTGTNR